MSETTAHTYPPGVPCWVDLESADPQAAAEFYGALLGWAVTRVTPDDAPDPYLVATVEGRDVAGLGRSAAPPVWTTYVAVADVDAVAATVAAAGGSVAGAAVDIGPAGRMAACSDPVGAAFRLWRPGRRLGAQLVNVPATWNFSVLHTPDPGAVQAFYAAVFGWRFVDMGADGTWVQVPGYGQHLADTVDPEIFTRQASAPEGFADVVAGLRAAEPGPPSDWRVTFSVADRDATASAAQRLGGTVLDSADTRWARVAEIRDPLGAQFTVSQFAPPTG